MNHDSALEVAYEDDYDEYDDFEKDEINNLIAYEHHEERTNKKQKEKWEEDKEEFKGNDNESEELENRCESDDNNGATKKKYPMFKLLRDLSDYKWEVGMYFSIKVDFKEAVTSFDVKSGRNLKFIKYDKIWVRVRCKDGCDWEAYCIKLSNDDS